MGPGFDGAELLRLRRYRGGRNLLLEPMLGLSLLAASIRLLVLRPSLGLVLRFLDDWRLLHIQIVFLAVVQFGKRQPGRVVAVDVLGVLADLIKS